MSVIYYVTEIHFDFGIISTLGAHCRSLGIRKPLLLTDRTIEATGIAGRACAALGDIEPRTFAEIEPNPLEKTVHTALDLYLGSQCDGLLALGGGSVIDTAKAVGLLASNGGRVGDYVGPRSRPIEKPLPPIITIPTNAGSGSEISRGLGVGVGENGEKANLLHPKLFPTLALCDPELTFSAPRQLTAMSAIDALSHCIEGFISPRINPPVEAICLDGMARIWEHVEAACRDPRDRSARWQMMMGSIEGGMAMPKGLGAAHALAIPMDRLHLPHGAIIAVILPKVLRWYGSCLDHKRDALLAALKLPPTADLADALEGMCVRLGLSTSLRSLGVSKAVLPEIARSAAASPYQQIIIKPAPLEAYVEILEDAF